MRASSNRKILLYGAIAGLLILSAGLGYALWQDLQGDAGPGQTRKPCLRVCPAIIRPTA